MPWTSIWAIQHTEDQGFIGNGESDDRNEIEIAGFDPDDEDAVNKWHQKAQSWFPGSDLDLSLRPPSSALSDQRSTHSQFHNWEPYHEDSPMSAVPLRPFQQPRAAFSFDDQPLRDDASEKAESIGGSGSQGDAEFVAMTLPLWHEVCFIAVICLSMFTTMLGLGQVLILLPTIGAAFHVTNPGDLGWLVAGYSLTVGTFILVSGRLGDVYGYKKMLVIGYLWFAVWNTVVGLSIFDRNGGGYVLFVFARVLSGIGPAITMPNGLAIFGSAYPDGMRKNMAFALFGACGPSGAIVGATFAGLFDLAWWPWTFWSFSMVLVVLAGLCMLLVPSVPRDRPVPETWIEIVWTLDLLGGAVGVTALVLINFAWNQAGVVGWQHSYVYICLMLGIILIPVFLVIEIYVAKEPLVPFYALTSDVAFVMACIACGWGSFGIWLFYLVQFYQQLRGASILLASAWFSPIAASGLSASVATGILVGKLQAKWIMLMSMTCFTVGIILVATAPVDQSYWAQTFVCSLIIPWGMDMSFPAGTLIMSNSVAKEHQGVAASLINTIVNYSISLGLGIAGTVEMQVNQGGKTRDEKLRGYRGAWYLGIGIAGLGLVISVVFATLRTTQARQKDLSNEVGGTREKAPIRPRRLARNSSGRARIRSMP